MSSHPEGSECIDIHSAQLETQKSNHPDNENPQNLATQSNAVQQKRDRPSKTPPITNKKFRQRNIHAGKIDIVEAEEKLQLDILLAQLFFGCNLPFSTVDSVHFEKFVNKLRPGYKIPHSNTLKSTLLDEAYSRELQKGHSQEKQYGTLMFDGWKNDNNQQRLVTTMIKPRNGKEMFLKSYDFTSRSEDIPNLLDMIIDASEKSSAMYNIEVEAVITDNAANVKGAARESFALDYTCLAHIGNLAVKDVYEYDMIGKPVRELISEFKNRSGLQAAVKESGGSKMYLANSTR